jgi:hypothetical protein
VTLASGEHVFYIGSNYHVYQFYMPWNGSWVNQDLTANAGGLPDYDGYLAAFADGAGEHVFYMDDNLRHVHQLFWSWSGSKWVDQDLTGQSSGASLISSGLTAFYDAWGEHAIYPALVGGVVHIDQLYVPWGKNWVNQDLTATNNGHVALDATPLTSFADVLGESIYYLDTNEHVNQLFAEADWANEDLTVLAGSTTTAFTECPGFLTSFSDRAGDHVFYIGSTDENMHQFYRDGLTSGWADQNLTQGLPASEQPFAAACLIQ